MLPRSLDPAAVWEAIFESNGWGDSWRGEIYDYLHYHSRIHEVLGIPCRAGLIKRTEEAAWAAERRAG